MMQRIVGISPDAVELGAEAHASRRSMSFSANGAPSVSRTMLGR